MTLDYRSDDAVITVCQKNDDKSIEIHDVNPAACEMLGYPIHELMGQPLKKILPERIGDLLQEYVEFEDDANDVGMVLAKVQSFSVLGKDGKESAYRMKLVRAYANAGTHYFTLVLQDKAGIRRNEAVLSVIAENFKGHESLDRAIGLPDRASLNKDIGLMERYMHNSGVRSCFAVFQLDHYEELAKKYEPALIRSFLAHVAATARQSLRPDDVVGSLGSKRLGVLLVDTFPESSRMVFNRLRWQVAANPYMFPDNTTLGLSVSVAFIRIGGRVNERLVIEFCENALHKAGAAAVNTLVEVAS